MDSNSNRTNRGKLRRLYLLVSYWFKLILQPVIAVVFVVGLAWLFGYMQRNYDWFNNARTSSTNERGDEADATYACAMLCVFMGSPGRCPVCGMELQKVKSQGDPKDIYGVTIEPAARRLANIETVAALNLPIAKNSEVLGRVTYDETTETTISAYVDGRIEDLFVDFTGAEVRQGEALAVLFSPDLYADQIGLLQAYQAVQKASANERIANANQRLFESAKQRLIEQGLPEQAVQQLISSGKAERKITITAPVTGTVVQKLVEEGSYVKTGTPLFRTADLSNVWLMLELFPEDAANLRLGQTVAIELRSESKKSFEGKISFVDPMVNPKTQTVNVRVVVPNDAGLIKIGDFASARIETRRESADPLVVVPRESVLMNGSDSIAYVETRPGRFEFRKVEVSEVMGDQIAIAEGIRPGEMVVASGAFMLDSTFNIQGKVSLIDPNRAVPQNETLIARASEEAKEIEESFKDLTPADRSLAESQVICPVTEVKLGTMGMGAPIRIAMAEQDVMICCAGCEDRLRKEPEKYLAVLERYRTSLSNEDRNESGAAPKADLPQMELPQMELPQMELPQMELPQMETLEEEVSSDEETAADLPQMEAPR